jgi:DNA-binding MarR family transcriptional regulator
MNYLGGQDVKMEEFEAKKIENLINEIVSCCDGRAWAESQRFGIPYAEIEVLKNMSQDRYATVTGLSQRLGVAKSRITKLISSLSQRGLVAEADDPNDGRVKLFGLTQRGRDLVKKIQTYEKDTYLKLLACFRPEEREMVLKALDLLRTAMEKVKAEL